MNDPDPIRLVELIVAPTSSILDTMRVIDRTGLEVALVCDPQRHLLALVTDGDIRRAILAGRALSDPIDSIGNRTFTSVNVSMPRHALVQLMLVNGFKCLPVVDAHGRILDLHTLRTALIGQDTGSWAVVMAGGRGERLGELTKAIPKPMLPLGDRPILQHIVEHLVAHGIRRIFLSVNYLGPMIEEHFGDGSRFLCHIEYLRETKPLGTGGPLALLPGRPKHPLVVMNGDLVTNIDITKLLLFHTVGKYAATMCLHDHLIETPSDVVDLSDSRVINLATTTTLNYKINAGIYAISPETLPLIPADQPFPITQLLQDCLDRRLAVGAYRMRDETWNDVGTPHEYRSGIRPTTERPQRP